jgi:hypothetical protein
MPGSRLASAWIGPLRVGYFEGSIAQTWGSNLAVFSTLPPSWVTLPLVTSEVQVYPFGQLSAEVHAPVRPMEARCQAGTDLLSVDPLEGHPEEGYNGTLYRHHTCNAA